MTITIHPNPAEQAAEQQVIEPTATTMPTVVPRSSREAALAQLTTATADTATGRRVRGLLNTLREIEADRQMANRLTDPGNWLAELARENRDIWDHLAEALAPVSSANTPNQQNTKEQISDGD